jgi:membrane associated rhomboid family serine protease
MGATRQDSLGRAVLLSAVFVAVLFAVEAVTILFQLPLQNHGIVPRTLYGLAGILFSPLLHANFHHVIANSVPLFVFLILLFANSKYHPGRTLALIWILSGLGTWLIGRGDAVHIGASSVVFGLAAFLIAAAFYARSWRAALVAVFVFLFYGGIFYGVLPRHGPISWEGHLCGAAAGAWAARNLRG